MSWCITRIANNLKIFTWILVLIKIWVLISILIVIYIMIWSLVEIRILIEIPALIIILTLIVILTLCDVLVTYPLLLYLICFSSFTYNINCLNWTIWLRSDDAQSEFEEYWLTGDTWWKRVPDEDWRRHCRVPGEDWRRHFERRAKIEEGTDFSQLAVSFIDPHLGQNPLY